MRHSFSTEFLKILPPATNFGEAWELLCLYLLRADTSDNTIMRFGPPDRGVDIFRQTTGAAYQCKSTERGIFGTIDPQECIGSLQKAIEAKGHIPWNDYSISLNAPLSGVGYSKIMDFAISRGINPTLIAVLSPEFWDKLCEKHKPAIEHMFDYRVFVSESQVLDAFHKARYYDRFIQQAMHHLGTAPLNVTVSNNRTEVALSLPFSGELTVEQLLNVVQAILGVSLDRQQFPDLGTSCAPSLSMAAGQIALPFKRKLSELTGEQLAKLQFWIRLVWREEKESEDNAAYRSHLRLMSQSSGFLSDRGRLTLDRMEGIIQKAIWVSIYRLSGSPDLSYA